MKMERSSLGERQTVAMTNCQSATVWIDYETPISQGRRRMGTVDLGLTEKSVLEYAQGGIGDNRIRMTKGRPLDF
jgi:hypothetical protein